MNSTMNQIVSMYETMTEEDKALFFRIVNVYRNGNHEAKAIMHSALDSITYDSMLEALERAEQIIAGA